MSKQVIGTKIIKPSRFVIEEESSPVHKVHDENESFTSYAVKSGAASLGLSQVDSAYAIDPSGGMVVVMQELHNESAFDTGAFTNVQSKSDKRKEVQLAREAEKRRLEQEKRRLEQEKKAAAEAAAFAEKKRLAEEAAAALKAEKEKEALAAKEAAAAKLALEKKEAAEKKQSRAKTRENRERPKEPPVNVSSSHQQSRRNRNGATTVEKTPVEKIPTEYNNTPSRKRPARVAAPLPVVPPAPPSAPPVANPPPSPFIEKSHVAVQTDPVRVLPLEEPQVHIAPPMAAPSIHRPVSAAAWWLQQQQPAVPSAPTPQSYMDHHRNAAPPGLQPSYHYWPGTAAPQSTNEHMYWQQNYATSQQPRGYHR